MKEEEEEEMYGSSIYLLKGLSEQAKAWIDKNIIHEPWQMLGDFIAVDHHYIENIVEGMKEEGFELGADFQVIAG
ncbi:unnamed protein product [marine sediment metagenome]|uniref:Uncharacterized protein n=1 Tax=marine sediment metagenome TaxID=412755 RepID=X1N3D0_9ZZZZ